jgi:epoxide hydrolase-like predicted phosphatase
MAAGVRNVIFDFGGVLVPWKPIEVIERFYADEALRPVIAQAILKHPDWLEMDRGTLDDDAAIPRFAERTGRSVEEVSAFLQHVRQSLVPVPEMVTLVHELAARGVSVYGLSNMATGTFAHLHSQYDLWKVFKGIVISAHIRMMKPDAEIFEHIARTYALTPGESVFIDDHSPNVEAAGRLGFRTILFQSPEQCAMELRHMVGG